MGSTVNVNDLSLVHKGSGGVAVATVPDVCLTPPVPVPVPYPNIAFSSTLAKGSKSVVIDGGNSAAVQGSEFSSSTGDEPGVAGGVASGTNMKEATWISHSFNVRIEGRNACRLTDKMLMNHGNTVCLAGELQDPVAPGAVAAPIEPIECATGPIKVGCKDRERFVLEVPCAKPPDSGVAPHVFQVVAGVDKADTIEAETTIEKPLCGNHGGQVLVVTEAYHNKLEPTAVSFDVNCDPSYGEGYWRHFWPHPARKRSYRLRSCCCHPANATPVEIEVYPDNSWKISDVEIGWPNEDDGFVFKGSVSCKRSGVEKKHSLELDTSLDLTSVFSFLDVFRDFIRHLLRGLTALGIPEIGIKWPSLSFDESTWGYEENEKDNSVEYPLKVKVAFDPLFGLKVKFDVLDALIGMLNPFGIPIGKVLQHAKRRLQAGFDVGKAKANVTIAVWFIAENEIGGYLAYERKVGQKRGVPEGGVDCSIEVSLEPEVSGRGELIVKAGAGVRGGGKGSIYANLGIKWDRGLCIFGKLGSDDVTLYLAVWVEADFVIKPFKVKYEHEKSFTVIEEREFLKREIHLFGKH